MNESDDRSYDYIYCVVTGRVQGVGFRVFVERQARQLNLRGWVRNGVDGRTVEMAVEGEETSIELFLGSVRQGPPLANVVEMRVSHMAGRGDFTEFVVRS